MNIFAAQLTPITGIQGTETLILAIGVSSPLASIPPGATAAWIASIKSSPSFAVSGEDVAAIGLTLVPGQIFLLNNLEQMKNFRAKGAAANDAIFVQYLTYGA